MIKTYKKIATIQAEQFDGSQGMIEKYKITITQYVPTTMFELETLEGSLNLDIGNWIATGIKGEHWAIADDVFKATYEEF